MQKTALSIPGLYVLQFSAFEDNRGKFTRIFCARELAEIGIEKPIAQINHSASKAVGTLRGMHFQNKPNAETKIVQCVRGKCFDVAVDLRQDSSTYLQWHGEYLDVNDDKAFVIPEGFAHGFLTLEPDTELMYFCTEYYTPEAEGGVRYDDPTIGIEWPGKVEVVSDKDLGHPLFSTL